MFHLRRVKEELADISLFDHVKLTAAIASCIYDYLNENHLNYKETLFSKETEFYENKTFLFCSLDISGIQKFIYTPFLKNALRTLKAQIFLSGNHDGAHYRYTS